jgi:hypothetical protein
MAQEHDHGARLSRAEAEIAELREGLRDLSANVTAGFKEVTAAIHEMRAQSGPAFRDILDIGTRVVMIFGAVTAGIIYLARGGTNPEIHALDRRLTQLETVLSLAVPRRTSLAPGLLMPPGGAVAAAEWSQ